VASGVLSSELKALQKQAAKMVKIADGFAAGAHKLFEKIEQLGK
jgi:hypothetical protein